MPGHSSDATHDVWRKRLGRFAQAGLPVARFCAGEGVSVASFYNWRKRLMSHPPRNQRGGEAVGRPARARASFQRVAVVPATPGVSIHLPGGTRIEVRAADLDAVRAVIAELVRGTAPQD